MLVAITTPSGSVSGTYPELSVRTRSKESRSVKRTGSSIVTPHSAVGNPKGIPVISATVAIQSAPELSRMSTVTHVMANSVKMSTPDLEDSMNTACVVIATFTPKPDRYDEVKRVLLEVSPEVHQEEGCELYALHEEVDGTLVLIEKWTTRELWQAHLALDTVTRIQKGVEGLLEGDVEVREMYGVTDTSYPESL
jgi:quinol monooxygenase YgiN